MLKEEDLLFLQLGYYIFSSVLELKYLLIK
jgi:hypothetical protein